MESAEEGDDKEHDAEAKAKAAASEALPSDGALTPGLGLAMCEYSDVVELARGCVATLNFQSLSFEGATASSHQWTLPCTS